MISVLTEKVFRSFLTLNAIAALFLQNRNLAQSGFSITGDKCRLASALETSNRVYRKSKNRLKRLTRSSEQARHHHLSQLVNFYGRRARGGAFPCHFEGRVHFRPDQEHLASEMEKARAADRALIRNAPRAAISHARTHARSSVN